MNKRIATSVIAFILIMILSTSMVFAAPAPAPVKLLLNGEPLTMKEAVKLDKNLIMFPFKALNEAIGFKVSFDTKTKTFTLTYDKIKMTIPVTGKNVSVNGKKQSIKPLKAEKGNYFIESAELTKLTGYIIEYDKSKNQIDMYTDARSKLITKYCTIDLVNAKVEGRITEAMTILETAAGEMTKMQESGSVDYAKLEPEFGKGLNILRDMRQAVEAIDMKEPVIKEINGLLISSTKNMIEGYEELLKGAKDGDAVLLESAVAKLSKAQEDIQKWEKLLNE